MGTSRSFDELATKLDRFAREAQRARREAIRLGVRDVRDAQLANARKFSGGDLRLSGVGRNGARVGVLGRVRSETRGIVKATGPWPLRDSSLSGGDVAPHIITSRYGGGSRASRASRLYASNARVRSPRRNALGPSVQDIAGIGIGPRRATGVRGAVLIPPAGGGEYRAFARHPGAPRRLYWEKTLRTVAPDVANTVADAQVNRPIRKVF